MFGLEKGRPRGDLTALLNFTRRGGREGGAGLCSLGTSDRTQGNGTKLGLGRFRLGTGNNLFPVRVTKHWSRLPSDLVVGVPCLLKRHLDTLVMCFVSWLALKWSGGWI